MKQLLLLVICLNYVICRWISEERQWIPEDERENCSMRCNEECVACTEPYKCTGDQVKCGEDPPKDHPDCPPDEICIPRGCLCKNLQLKLWGGSGLQSSCVFLVNMYEKCELCY